MTDGITITRSDRRTLHALIRQTPERVDALGRAVATAMVGEMVESFGTSPAPAGGPPGVDTGALRASVGWVAEGERRWLLHDGVEYGVYQELGVGDLPARPWMTPVFEAWRQRRFGQFAREFGVFG